MHCGIEKMHCGIEKMHFGIEKMHCGIENALLHCGIEKRQNRCIVRYNVSSFQSQSVSCIGYFAIWNKPYENETPQNCPLISTR